MNVFILFGKIYRFEFRNVYVLQTQAYNVYCLVKFVLRAELTQRIVAVFKVDHRKSVEKLL